MFDVFSIAVGAVGVGVGYFIYLAASKGLPAAWTWLKAKWTAGEAELETLKADIIGANAKVDALVKGDVATLKTGLNAVQADVATLKKSAATTATAGQAATPPAAAPITPAAPPTSAAAPAAAAPASA